jgi:hypothetical protein
VITKVAVPPQTEITEMTDNAQHGCTLCPVYRPDATPRHPDRTPVCDPHRERLTRDLAAIAAMHQRLIDPDPADIDTRWYQHHGRNGYIHWQRADPLADIGGSAPVPGRNDQPRVGGSRERPAPTNLDHVDLTATARAATIDVQMRAIFGYDPDQIGHLSVATELDAWVRDWRDSLWPDHHLPAPTVPNLVDWLANRVDTACDQHPAVDEFAAKMAALAHTLRAALGETEPRPSPIDGVACRHCDLCALVRNPGDIYEAECSACGLLYTTSELHEWLGRLAAYERSVRTPEQIAQLVKTRRTAS